MLGRRPLVRPQRILGLADQKLTSAIFSHLEADALSEAIERIDDSGGNRERAIGA